MFLTSVASLACARTAKADVLVSAIPKQLVCGDAITAGIWAQPGTTGNRTVKMRAIDRRTGKVWWRKTAKARTRELSDGVKAKYRIHFRPEGG